MYIQTYIYSISIYLYIRYCFNIQYLCIYEKQKQKFVFLNRQTINVLFQQMCPSMNIRLRTKKKFKGAHI